MVVEVVKECAEDFMFDKRILALVKGLIEDGVVESVGPIAAEVYYKAAVSGWQGTRRANGDF